MARRTYNELVEAVQAKISAAGGTIGHDSLIDALQADRINDAARQLPAMAARGDIVAQVTTSSDGPPVLRYRLAGNAPAQEGGIS